MFVLFLHLGKQKIFCDPLLVIYTVEALVQEAEGELDSGHEEHVADVGKLEVLVAETETALVTEARQRASVAYSRARAAGGEAQAAVQSGVFMRLSDTLLSDKPHEKRQPQEILISDNLKKFLCAVSAHKNFIYI